MTLYNVELTNRMNIKHCSLIHCSNIEEDIFFVFSYTSNPPPFHKHESRFEREQKIRVGSVDAYKPGENELEPHPDR